MFGRSARMFCLKFGGFYFPWWLLYENIISVIVEEQYYLTEWRNGHACESSRECVC